MDDLVASRLSAPLKVELFRLRSGPREYALNWGHGWRTSETWGLGRWWLLRLGRIRLMVCFR